MEQEITKDTDIGLLYVGFGLGLASVFYWSLVVIPFVGWLCSCLGLRVPVNRTGSSARAFGWIGAVLGCVYFSASAAFWVANIAPDRFSRLIDGNHIAACVWFIAVMLLPTIALILPKPQMQALYVAWGDWSMDGPFVLKQSRARWNAYWRSKGLGERDTPQFRWLYLLLYASVGAFAFGMYVLAMEWR